MSQMKPLGLLMGVAGLLLGACPDSQAALLINEVLVNPGGLDANGDGIAHATQDEFIELVNRSLLPVPLAGFRLADAVGVRHAFGAGDVIPSLGFFVVFGGGAPVGFSHAVVASTGRLALNNSGDTISLLDAGGVLIDTFSYPTSTPGASLTRSPDGTGSFIGHSTISGSAFSPGVTVNGATQLPTAPAEPTAPIPEPSTLYYLGLGLLGWLPLTRRHSGTATGCPTSP